MSLIEATSDIPLPPQRYQLAKYPFSTMEVGESFAYPSDVTPETCWTTNWRANRIYSPKKFISRKLNGEMRCWRIL